MRKPQHLRSATAPGAMHSSRLHDCPHAHQSVAIRIGNSSWHLRERTKEPADNDTSKPRAQRGNEPPDAVPTFLSYERRLAHDGEWALTEGSRFFEGKGAVQQALHKIADRLNALNIPYAVIGGMALFRHGHRRFTEDVDILVTREGLAMIHSQLEGLGYLRPFPQSKHLRDTDLGVKIEFVLTGDFPGDGKPKPVAFPDPATVTVVHDGIHFVTLLSLVEMKLASGMTNVDRMKDLVDVLELIKALALPKEFSQQLSPYVQEKFIELWTASRAVRRKFIRRWTHALLDSKPRTMADLIAATDSTAVAELATMKEDGVELDSASSTEREVYLVTSDPEIARKYAMEETDND